MDGIVIGATIGWFVIGLGIRPRIAWQSGVALIGAGAMASALGWGFAGWEEPWRDLLRAGGAIFLPAGLLWVSASIACWGIRRHEACSRTDGAGDP